MNKLSNFIFNKYYAYKRGFDNEDTLSGIQSMQGWRATTSHGVVRKRRKRLKANKEVVKREPKDKSIY